MVRSTRESVQVQRRSRRLMKTLTQVSDFMDTIDDYRQDNRVKHRLQFNPKTFGEMADNLIEGVHQGVGKVRTKAFDVDDII